MMEQTNSISEYIKRNNDRKNVRWRFSDGELMFEYDIGLWFNEKNFDALVPYYEYKKFNEKGINPDGKRLK
jgi:hypothetical protein